MVLAKFWKRNLGILTVVMYDYIFCEAIPTHHLASPEVSLIAAVSFFSNSPFLSWICVEKKFSFSLPHLFGLLFIFFFPRKRFKWYWRNNPFAMLIVASHIVCNYSLETKKQLRRETWKVMDHCCKPKFHYSAVYFNYSISNASHHIFYTLFQFLLVWWIFPLNHFIISMQFQCTIAWRVNKPHKKFANTIGISFISFTQSPKQNHC